MGGNKLWFFWVVQVVISTCCHPVERYVFFFFLFDFCVCETRNVKRPSNRGGGRSKKKEEKKIEEEKKKNQMRKKMTRFVLYIYF